jgi:hypothetical protein
MLGRKKSGQVSVLNVHLGKLYDCLFEVLITVVLSVPFLIMIFLKNIWTAVMMQNITSVICI